MKAQYPEYEKPEATTLEDIWARGLVVLDTNILLRLYESSEATATAIFAALEGLKRSRRLWIPFKVLDEYYRTRERTFDEIESRAHELGRAVRESLEPLIEKLENMRHPALQDRVVAEIRGALAKVTNITTGSERPDVRGRIDAVTNSLDRLFDDNIGNGFSEKRIAEICDTGERRYKQRIPPGFEDSAKRAPDKYGDLIIWMEILDKAKTSALPMLFVTEDTKADWWLRTSSGGGNVGRIVGPEPMLLREFHTTTGQWIWIYSLSDFLEQSRTKLQIENATPEAVSEIRTAEEMQRARVAREWQSLESLLAGQKELTRSARARRLQDILSEYALGNFGIKIPEPEVELRAGVLRSRESELSDGVPEPGT